MEQRVPSAPHDPSPRWLETHASSLFAAVRRVVPDSVRAYDLGLELAAMIRHPLTLTVSNADLHRLSELARTPLDLDADAVDALAALERSAPPAHLLSSLDPSHLIRRASSDVRPKAR